MSIDLNFLGSKLKRCREQLQFSMDEVSTKTGISIGRITELEGGAKEPSGDEILIFADLYKQDYRFFISNQQQTATEQVETLYRKFGDEFSKEDRWAIQEFIYLCECEESVLNHLNYKKLEFHFEPKGTFFKQHALDAAKKLRDTLGYKPSNLISDFYFDFRKIGIHIFRRRLKNKNFSGLFINHPWAGKCILVNYDEDIYRQNFTLAHEVGHAIFDYKEDINISFTEWSQHDLKEIRANTFASNFLIPTEALKAIKVNKWDEKILKQVANKLNINTEPLLISLKGIGLITDIEFRHLKKVKIEKSEKEDPELKGLVGRRRKVKESLLEKGLSSFYVRNCFESYSQGSISAKRLAEMLLSDEFELPEILDLFNLKLIYDN